MQRAKIDRSVRALPVYDNGCPPWTEKGVVVYDTLSTRFRGGTVFYCEVVGCDGWVSVSPGLSGVCYSGLGRGGCVVRYPPWAGRELGKSRTNVEGFRTVPGFIPGCVVGYVCWWCQPWDGSGGGIVLDNCCGGRGWVDGHFLWAE